MHRDRLFRIGAEATWVAIGQLAAFVGGFVTIKVLTVQLGPAAYGQLALGISAAGILHMFVYGPIEQIALRFVSVYRERGQLGLLFDNLGTIHTYAGLFVIVGIICIAAVVQIFSDASWSMLILVALLFGLASGINMTLSSLQSALRQRASVAFFQASDVWLRLLLACAGLLYFGATANIALLGFCIAAAATAVVQIAWMSRNPLIRPWLLESPKADPQSTRRIKSELVMYGRPYIAFAAFGWLSTFSDRWVILTYLDEKAVGIYAALFQIANAPIALFIGVTNQFLVPLIFNRAGTATTNAQIRSSSKLLNTAVAGYILALAGIIIIAAVFGSPLVRLITNEEFSPHAGNLWIICLGLSLANIAQLLVTKGLSHSRPQDYIFPKFVQLVLLMTSILILIRPLGLTGVALSLCISGAGYLIAIIAVNRRLYPSGT